MRRRNILIFLALMGLFWSLKSGFAQKPRVVVMTDISDDEPDDKQSLVRFLLYANEFKVEGLIATTSIWRWRGKDKVRPDLIRECVNAYGEVRENLLRHAAGYPTEASLLGLIKKGQFGEGMEVVGEGQSTEASRHIIAVVDGDDERPVWILLWGGGIDLAQALWDVKHSRGPEGVATFVAKLRVYEIAGQDNTGAWIAHTFPDIFWIRSAVQFQGISRRIDNNQQWEKARGGNESVFEADWIDKHIQSHGPLGALYPDPHYKHEGDTPSFLHLLPTGLAEPEQISYGNWGGRFIRQKQRNPPAVDPVKGQDQYEPYQMYTGAADTWTYDDGSTTYRNNVFAPLFRWRTAFQNDFAARMDWSVTSDYKKANHPPVASLQHPNKLTVRSGDTVRLDASASTDPDGDALDYRWFPYREVGRYRGRIKLKQTGGVKSSFTAPEVDETETVHIILEVTDNGSPALIRYQRIIIDLLPKHHMNIE